MSASRLSYFPATVLKGVGFVPRRSRRNVRFSARSTGRCGLLALLALSPLCYGGRGAQHLECIARTLRPGGIYIPLGSHLLALGGGKVTPTADERRGETK